MASVYGKSRDKKRQGASWYITSIDEHGKRTTIKGCPDKSATEAMSRKFESEADLRRRGIIDPRTDAYSTHEARPLADHLTEWHAYLIGKGSTENHANLSRNQVARLIELARAKRISDLTPSRVQASLKGVRDTGVRDNEDRTKGGSLRSVHHDTRVLKGFSRWLWRDGRGPIRVAIG